jgi:hypothetical protein
MGAFLCSAGTKGRRFALPNARFLMQKTGFEEQVCTDIQPPTYPFLPSIHPSIHPSILNQPHAPLTLTLPLPPPPLSPPPHTKVYGQASDIVLEVENSIRDNQRFLKELSDITGRSPEQIKEDFKCVRLLCCVCWFGGMDGRACDG